MTTPTPVVELVRVSTETQAMEERAGIPAQRATNRQTCLRFGLRVIETVEIVESGATVAQSPAMGRVLDLITQGRARGIVLAAYDRLFRPDRWSDLAILQVITDARASIYVPAGPIDLQTEVGYVQATVGNLLAGLEKRRIRERTTRAKEEMRRQGKLASGRPPFGLAYDKSTGWSYTAEIEQVKAMFALYLSGQERSFARLGERFGCHPTIARDRLMHPAYSGWLSYERTDGRESIKVPLGLPPAVSQQDFDEVQRIVQMRSSRLSLARSGDRERFLYRGMIFCTCGYPMYGTHSDNPQGRRWYNYACGSRKLREKAQRCGVGGHLSARLLDQALDRVIAERFTDPDFILPAVMAYNRSIGAEWRESIPSPGANARRIGELERRKDRILESFYDGDISAEQKKKRVADVDVQLDALRSYQLPVPPQADEIEPGDVLGILTQFAEWEHLEREAKRSVLEALAPAFEVGRKYLIRGVYLDVLRPRHSVGESRTAHSKTRLHYRTWLYLPIGARVA